MFSSNVLAGKNFSKIGISLVNSICTLFGLGAFEGLLLFETRIPARAVTLQRFEDINQIHGW